MRVVSSVVAIEVSLSRVVADAIRRRQRVASARRWSTTSPGPSYTIGIEEELMIVDAETFDLVNAIESLLEDAPDGEIKPELMESVLEIATDPCAEHGRGRRSSCAALRRAGARRARRPRA